MGKVITINCVNYVLYTETSAGKLRLRFRLIFPLDTLQCLRVENSQLYFVWKKFYSLFEQVAAG